MQDQAAPDQGQVQTNVNLTSIVRNRGVSAPDAPVLSHRVGDEFVDISATQFAERVRDLAAGFRSRGVKAGDRVAILSRSRPEWTMIDYAVWTLGGVTVPIYETSSRDQIRWIIRDSGARTVVCANADLVDTVDGVTDQLDVAVDVLSIEDGDLDILIEQGAAVDHDEIMETARGVAGSDLATVVYTSGTTGRPKGCMLTHAHFVWEAQQLRECLPELLRPDAATLLFLPLAHIFARVIQVACIEAGVRLGYGTGVTHLLHELRLFQPTFLLAVPRVYERIFAGARRRAHEDDRGPIFDRAVEVAITLSSEQQNGDSSLATRMQHSVFERLVYGRLREALGGRVEYAVSGGAPLSSRLGHFFTGIGIPMLEGYGLTETTAGVTINRPDHNRIGSVGPPLPGCRVRVAEDDEILIKGPNVFAGYWNDDESTEEIFDPDGWLRTGDAGSLNEDGTLTITGRLKDLIVTAGGKNVAPQPLEERLRAHPLVGEAVVIGDERPFVSALLALDPEELARWASERGRSGTSVASLGDDDELRAELQDLVDRTNETVSRAEAIREFRVVPSSLGIETGELTPTMKVRRPVVSQRYRDLIEEIYAGG